MPARATSDVARKIFLIATEESGDRLGASLMKVLRQRLGGAVQFEGVGGQSMAREGLASLFPIEELSIIGLAAVVKQLPKILRLIRQTTDAVIEASPDILVIIDSPDFTHRVARRVRASDPSIHVRGTARRPSAKIEIMIGEIITVRITTAASRLPPVSEITGSTDAFSAWVTRWLSINGTTTSTPISP